MDFTHFTMRSIESCFIWNSLSTKVMVVGPVFETWSVVIMSYSFKAPMGINTTSYTTFGNHSITTG